MLNQSGTREPLISSQPQSLTLENVSIGTLENISFAVAPGETVCLSGPSGSGKSRLLRAIADLEPHAGEICLGERGQSDMPGHQWRRQVILVPSESQWWADTVGQHFEHPAGNGIAALGFEPEAMDWPVARLSSGEKQRLALARALFREPRALLLDEPTANLDGEATRITETWLRGLVGELELPVLWVAHDPEQIRRVATRHFEIRGTRLEPVQ